MFLSKIWFVLVGLLAGVATTAAFVAPRSADRRIVELEGQRLDRAQYAAEQMLKADAHNWIDYVAKLGRDAILAESLDSATRGAGEPRLLVETVRGRLKTLAPDLAGMGLEAIGAVDGRGRLVGRIGEKESETGEGMGGLEVIADALRGYMSDDVWGFQGKLRRVAAVPVLSKTRDRIVGAVYVAAESGKRLAEVWKKNLGVDIAILLRGEVLTATVPESFLSNLPALIEARAAEIAQAKRTRPIPLDIGSDEAAGGGRPLRGHGRRAGGPVRAAGQDVPRLGPPGAAVHHHRRRPALRQLPLAGAGRRAAGDAGDWPRPAAAGDGTARWASCAPRCSAWPEETSRSCRTPATRASSAGIARDVNAAMERFTLAAAPQSETAKKDLDAILGPAPAEPASVFDLPQSHLRRPGPRQQLRRRELPASG